MKALKNPPNAVIIRLHLDGVSKKSGHRLHCLPEAASTESKGVQKLFLFQSDLSLTSYIYLVIYRLYVKDYDKGDYCP